MPASPVTLHVSESGQGQGLVLLHPIGLDGGFWGKLVAMASADHRVLCLDLRGHGRSPKADRATRLADYVEDIHAAILHHGAGPATVLGLSFGGMLAQCLALTHPEDVAGLVLSGCGAGFDDSVRPTLRERGLAAERDGMASLVPTTIERWFTESFRNTPAVEQVRRRLQANDPVSWSAGWHAISEFEARSRLGDIGVPTLVISGGQDAATPQAASKLIADGIPGAEFVVLDAAPHMMQIEAEDRYIAAVGDFLRRRGAAVIGPRSAR
jgi:3-oxoadipate enol-lactonase